MAWVARIKSSKGFFEITSNQGPDFIFPKTFWQASHFQIKSPVYLDDLRMGEIYLPEGTDQQVFFRGVSGQQLDEYLLKQVLEIPLRELK